MAYRLVAFTVLGGLQKTSGNRGACRPQLTEPVDNFVSKWHLTPRKPAPELRYDKTMKF